jgi:hypothetical protein
MNLQLYISKGLKTMDINSEKINPIKISPIKISPIKIKPNKKSSLIIVPEI